MSLEGTPRAVAAVATAGNIRSLEIGLRRTSVSSIIGLYVVIEIAAITLACFLSAYAYWSGQLGMAPTDINSLLTSLLIALAIAYFDTSAGRYQSALQQNPRFVWYGLRVTLKAFTILIALLFLLKISDSYSRGTLVSQLAASVLVILTLRAVFQKLLHEMLSAGRLEIDRVVVIGSLARDWGFLNRLSNEGMRVVAARSLEEDVSKPDANHLVRYVVDVCRRDAIGRVIVAPSEKNGAIAQRIIRALAETPVTVHIVPREADVPIFQNQNTENIGGFPSAIVVNRPVDAFNLALKRVLDLILCVVALLIFVPVLLLVAVAIKFDSKGPVLFRQTRHGYGARPIRVFKFRSMRVTEDGAAVRQATQNDPRITRVGQIIRRTNLDELPQLFNVLLGEMSMVGPRPHPVVLNESFADRVKWFNRRHNMPPGITGWAQINGYRGETETLEKMVGRVEHDLWYLDNWSLYLDIKILILTLFSPAAYRGAR